jgi:protein-disulfide isomerase
MSNTRWFVFAALCIAIIAGVVIFAKPTTIDVSKVDPAKIETEGPYADHIYGNKDAKVVLIEYGDYQCPGCGSAHPNVKVVTEKYKNDVAFIFRNLPLTNLHPNALAAASAAEAAGKQGKYWEMHDRLFETQNSWNTATTAQRSQIFEGYARDLGLNLDTFRTDASGDPVAEKIAYDRALAKKVNAASTPTFFINGKLLEGTSWSDAGSFERTITDALAQAGVTPTPTPAEAPGGNE